MSLNSRLSSFSLPSAGQGKEKKTVFTITNKHFNILFSFYLKGFSLRGQFVKVKRQKTNWDWAPQPVKTSLVYCLPQRIMGNEVFDQSGSYQSVNTMQITAKTWIPFYIQHLYKTTLFHVCFYGIIF